MNLSTLTAFEEELEKLSGSGEDAARAVARWYTGASPTTKAMLGFAALGAALKGAEGAGDTSPVFDQRMGGLRDPNLVDRFNRTAAGAARGGVLGAGGAALTGLLMGKFGSAHKDLIPGGLADDKEPSEFPKDKLRAGVKVEKEHTSVPAIAEEIAMDHLTEDPKYYKKLKRIEK